MPRGAPDWFYGAPQKTLEQLLREGNAFSDTAVTPEVAGKISLVQLWNHIGSGVGVLLYRVSFEVGNNALVYIESSQEIALNDFGTAVCRHTGLLNSQLHMRGQAEGIVGAGVLSYERALADTMYHHYPLFIWLAPGWGVHVAPILTNTLVRALFWWFEFTEY
ncbi:MAG: hypothetical protein HWN68_11120 [Desulfobacterales bacterium]|nr:hypothetical protein [Desulfobacterales bacterium]